jgi:hypothetical protein
MTHEIESFQTIGACVERLTEFRNFKVEVYHLNNQWSGERK